MVYIVCTIHVLNVSILPTASFKVSFYRLRTSIVRNGTREKLNEVMNAEIEAQTYAHTVFSTLACLTIQINRP